MKVTQWLVLLSLAPFGSGLERETKSMDERELFLQRYDMIVTPFLKIIVPTDLMKRVGEDLMELTKNLALQIYDEIGIDTLMRDYYDFDSGKRIKLIDTAYSICFEPLERFLDESKIF